MKNILFPTELSPHTSEVFQYALSLADVFEAKILMMHAIGMPRNPDQNPDFEERTAKVIDELMAFKEAHQPDSFGHVKISYMAEIGFPAATILEAAEDEKVDLIVMGSHGKTNALERYFGGVSTQVMNQAKCPVLIIPPATKFNGWNHLGCTTNFHFEDLIVLNTLSKWSKKIKTELTCLHVQENETPEMAAFNINVLKEVFAEHHSIQFQTRSGDIKSAINRFTKETGIGLLGMVHHHKSLVAYMKNSDITKGVANKIPVPLIVFNLP